MGRLNRVRFAGAVVVLLLIPMACSLAVLVHTRGTAAPTSDSGVYVGLASNLHDHGSMTAPTDPNWLLASPAQVAARRGFVPIPDFAPIYSMLGALTPDPVDGFSAGHVMALLVVLGALGAVVHRASGSLLVALLAQVVFAVGPTGAVPGLPHFTSLDLATVIQADLVALAFFVAALCLIVVRSPDERPMAVIATLLGAATLTRFAYWGAVAGIAAVLLVALPRPLTAGHRATRRWLGASLLVAPAWAVGYRTLTGSGPAKTFHVHVRSLALIGRTMIGWLGFDVARPAFGTLAVAVVVIGSCAAAWRGRDAIVRLAGGALLGYLIVDVVTLWFFDLGYAAFSERALLPVRFLLIVIVTAQIAGRVRVVHRHALTASVAALLAAWFVTGQLQSFDVGVVPYVPAQVVASVPRDVPILTYLPDRLYLDAPRPMIGLPQAIEPSTGERLDIRAQAEALVGALRVFTTRAVVVIPSQLFVQEIRQDQWPSCARVLHLRTVAGTLRYELDIDRCSHRRNS